jgi:hypothetical protein
MKFNLDNTISPSGSGFHWKSCGIRTNKILKVKIPASQGAASVLPDENGVWLKVGIDIRNCWDYGIGPKRLELSLSTNAK